MAISSFALSQEGVQKAEPALITQVRPWGPISSRLRRRTAGVYALLCGIGILPTVFHAPAPLQAAGWGLWMPGAGFVAAGGWWTLLFPVTLALFAVGIFLWVVSGNMLGWLVLWIGTAFGASFAAGDTSASYTAFVIPALSIGFLVRAQLKTRESYHRASERGRRGNAALPAITREISGIAEPEIDPATAELTPGQLHAARYIFDRCLQPVGKFDGFIQTDPFQFSGYHYQLAISQYALGIMQNDFTPNFHGYLNKAQRYTIESLATPEACAYWKWENLWGNFRWAPDPIATKDNIMLTGWSGVCLSTYAANTGDRRYGEKGCLEFRTSKGMRNGYRHDAHSFMQSVTHNFDTNKSFMLYPCEPGFTYSVCNMYAFNSAIAYDRAWGTDIASNYHAEFRRRLIEEFELPDGRFQQGISERFGLTVVFQPFVNGDAGIAVQLNAFAPDLGERAYALLRLEHVQRCSEGQLAVKWVDPLDSLDTNWRAGGRSFACAQLAIAAREFGDREVAELAWNIVETNYAKPEDGSFGYIGASTPSQIMMAWAALHTRNAWRKFIVDGPTAEARVGPLLTECAYPEVLVARARSIDGVSLDLVLYDGNGPSMQPLNFERLHPKAEYKVMGAQAGTVVADADGRASIEVMIAGRTEVRLVRASIV